MDVKHHVYDIRMYIIMRVYNTDLALIVQALLPSPSYISLFSTPVLPLSGGNGCASKARARVFKLGTQAVNRRDSSPDTSASDDLPPSLLRPHGARSGEPGLLTWSGKSLGNYGRVDTTGK